MRPIDKVLDALAALDKKIKSTGPRKWQSVCPGHDDTNPSLSIEETGSGKVLLYCFGGCKLGQILDGLGLQKRDLFPDDSVYHFDTQNQTRNPKPPKPKPDKKIYSTIEKAAQAIAGQVKGTPAGQWPYSYADGKEAFIMLRFNLPDGNKTFRPIHHNGAGFIQADPPGKLPLYQLTELDGAARVFVVEGEKAADAGRSIGLPCVTTAHGAKSPHKTDWTPLAGREIVTLADNDPPGKRYADEVKKILLQLNPPAKIKIVELPGLPQGGDIFDYIEARDSVEPETLKAGIETMADDAPFVDTLPSQTETLETELNLTDAGNGERLARRYGDKLRFCMNWGKWLVFDGKRWDRETGATEARRLAVLTARAIRDEADLTDEIEAKRKILSFALRSESKNGLDCLLNEGRHCLPITSYAKDFDADPMILNVLNGTIDLKTGKLKPHHAGDRITKLAPVTYDPAAELQLWNEFLIEATGNNQDLLEFLQIAAGYSLTGDTGAEKLFFVHGPAAAGKSTFLEAIKSIMGEYAVTSDFETFLQKPGGGIRNDIARLEGARLVASIEVDDGKRMAEGLVKMLTGGDTIAARYLYQESFEYKPQFKLWLAANHAPKVRDDDAAMWRRILRIPFEIVIPPERRDPAVKKTLTNPKQSGAAILAWAVRGCLGWQESGLFIPECVQVATNTYREDMDPLRDFFRDCCLFQDGAFVAVSDLRKRYDFWASENGIRWTIGSRDFNDRIREKGCEVQSKWLSGRNQKCWTGIGLQSYEENS